MVGGNTSSPSSHRPRSSPNVGIHHMLAAAIGLTSLGSSSPTESSPSPSERSASKMPFVGAAKAAEVIRLAQARENSLFVDTEFFKQHQALTRAMPPSAIMADPPAQQPVYLENLKPHYPAAVLETVRPSALKSSLPWSPIYPSPTTAGYETLREQLVDRNSGTPFSGSAMAMGRFSVNEQIAAMNRPTAVATASAPIALPSSYPYYHSHTNMSGASFPPTLAVPPQKITHIPNTKNFPETLLDIISSEENQHIISWLPHGRGFVVHDKQRFASMILPRYFDGAKFTSFTRRLKRWSYVRVPRGPELGAYYNKNFMRDQPELVRKMRYRTESQFEDGKKKGGEDQDEQHKKLENERLEEHIEKEVEAKIQASESKKEAAAPNAPLIVAGQNEYETQAHQAMQNHLLAKKYFLDLQDSPMPLPSALPKRGKRTPTGPRETNRNTASGISYETLIHHSAANAEESLLPMGHSPTDPQERQLVEMHRKLLLESMMSQEIATGRSINSLTSSIFTGTNNVSNHPNCTTAPDRSQRMLDVECANRMLEVERLLKTERILGYPNQIANQELLAAKITSPAKTHAEIMDAAMRDLKARLARPCIRSGDGICTNSIRDQMNTMLPLNYTGLATFPQELISNPRPNQQFDVANGLGETRRISRDVIISRRGG